MIPKRIIDYLEQGGAKYQRRAHPRAITAQELAASLEVTGYRVAKTVLIEADGKTWMAVLPAPELVDPHRLAQALGARKVRLLHESEFAQLFPGVEPGAEPPFGKLYGLPVLVELSLTREQRLVFRAGSHEEAIELDYAEYARLEQPSVASFGVLPERMEQPAQPELRA